MNIRYRILQDLVFSINFHGLLSISYLKCPLCGKLSHLKNFNPENFEDGVSAVEIQSQGKSFADKREHYILKDEELTNRIADRLRTLLRARRTMKKRNSH